MQLYAAGTFTAAPNGGPPLPRVARWDGTQWSPVGNGFNEIVNDLAVFDEGQGPRLFAAGKFLISAGTSTRRMAKWDGVAWTEACGGVTPDSPFTDVFTLHVHDDGAGPALFLGGNFSHVGNVAASRIAKWTGTQVVPLGAGLSNKPFEMTDFDDGSGPKLYVAGNFLQAGGASAPRVARWTGSAWEPCGSLPEITYALHAYDDGSGAKLYAGGDHSDAMRVWDGNAWQTLATPTAEFDAPVHALATFLHGDNAWPSLVIGGTFREGGSLPSDFLAAIDQPCAGQGTSYCTAGTTFSGCTANITSTGIASRSATSGFVVTVDDVEGQRDGVIFFGRTGPMALPWGNGTSWRCVAPPVVRTGVQDGVGAVGTCDNVYAVDFNAWMTSHPLLAPEVGATAWMQAWFRDPGSGSNQDTSFSDALSVLICP
jgi:hypothetical protein